MRKRIQLVGSLTLLLMLASCGGGGNESSAPPAPAGNAAPAAAAPAATATLDGKIMFDGTLPANSKIQMAADPYCLQNAKNPMTEEYVGENGGLGNVIVYVSSPVSGTFPTPTEDVTIDQHDCHYVPHVFTIMVGQKLTIKNSDTTLHNIHAFAEVNPEFNTGQPAPMTTEHVFDKPEMPLPFKCDVHKWMSAYAGVFTHPYHTVSKPDGTYEIKLAPGNYEITAWHEKFGTMKQNIQVADGQKVDLNFTFKPTTAD
jgi:plastocyanin